MAKKIKIEKKEFNKLPFKFKEKWLKALRSGDYKQGRKELFNDDNNSYCCLGVACRIASIPNNKLLNVCSPDYLIDKYQKRLPKAITDTFIGKGETENDATISKLIFMNDDEKKSFKQIANWIEKNL